MAISERKGYGRFEGFLGGFLLGPFGIVTLAVRKPDEQAIRLEKLKKSARKKCPRCSEQVGAEVIVCHACSWLIEQSIAVPPQWRPATTTVAAVIADENIASNTMPMAHPSRRR